MFCSDTHLYAAHSGLCCHCQQLAHVSHYCGLQTLGPPLQVDSPKCSFCSSTQMASSGIAPPTAAEAAHQASRAELHRCLLCSSMTRFPRYNDVGKLLETRWAQADAACCWQLF